MLSVGDIYQEIKCDNLYITITDYNKILSDIFNASINREKLVNESDLNDQKDEKHWQNQSDLNDQKDRKHWQKKKTELKQTIIK